MTVPLIFLSLVVVILTAGIVIAETRPRRPKPIPPTWIDLDTLGEIESGNNPLAVSRAGARGIYQITRPAWKDAIASIARDHPESAFAIADYDQWVTDPTISRSIAWEYVSRVIPRYLAARRLTETDVTGPVPDSTDARLAAWNAGTMTVRRAYVKSPANWQAHLPFETREFISRYHARLKVNTTPKG